MGKHRKASKRSTVLAAFGAAAVIPGLGLATAGEALAGPPGGWGPIITCESGGNPTIQNSSSTASGLFQFINGTWAAYGGREFAPTAKQATIDEQYIVAERAYAAEGTRPWNASMACWAGKTGEATIKKQATPVVEQPVEQRQALPVVVPQGRFTPDGGGSYTVKAGDTLTFIARDYSTSVAELVELNKDVIEHEDWIYVGEQLHLPENPVNAPVPQ